jgi:hypothetical protein
MRDVFVGIVFAVGAFLYLYKGFGKLENYALNLAGIFGVGVALLPLKTGNKTFPWDYAHDICAIGLFLCIAYVCLFRASDTLHMVKDEDKAKRYKIAYKAIGAAMIIAPAVAVYLTQVLQFDREDKSTVFFVEFAAVWIFALYWIVKSREIATTGVERLALEGQASLRDNV